MSENETTGTSIGRRAAIKKAAVAGAAVGVVWSAPKVEGLTLRPSYAAAASSVPITAWTATIDAVAPATFAVTGLAAVDCVATANAALLLPGTTVPGTDFVVPFNAAGVQVIGNAAFNCEINLDAITGPSVAVFTGSDQIGAIGTLSTSAAALRPAFWGALPVTISGNFSCT